MQYSYSQPYLLVPWSSGLFVLWSFGPPGLLVLRSTTSFLLGTVGETPHRASGHHCFIQAQQVWLIRPGSCCRSLRRIPWFERISSCHPHLQCKTFLNNKKTSTTIGLNKFNNCNCTAVGILWACGCVLLDPTSSSSHEI